MCSSFVPVSEQVSLNAEVVGVGVVSCLVVYPLYLLIFCLFRLSRSKVIISLSLFLVSLICISLKHIYVNLSLCQYRGAFKNKLLFLCVCVCQVLVEQLPSQVDQESLEIDDFLDNSLTGSSFLIFNGITEVR